MKYSLVGIDGNAFNVMSYVVHAMRDCDFEKPEIDGYLKQATASDYDNPLRVSMRYVDACNTRVGIIENYEE